jgi:hypothetical protein
MNDYDRTISPGSRLRFADENTNQTLPLLLTLRLVCLRSQIYGRDHWP